MTMRMRVAVKILVVCLALFGTFGSISGPQVSVFGAAQAQGFPSGWESYIVRPDIMQVPPRKHSLGRNWESLKAAHFSFVAELLVLYPPDTEIYFLARDSELLYDVARLVTQGTQAFSRIHLLNISRANMRANGVKAYLKENGISEVSLAGGRKVLFVDTGFSGTIPRVIGELFSNELRAKLKTHLIVSSSDEHPSSRAFLVHLNPIVNEQTPADMHGTIISYERLARYTERSSAFAYA